MFQRPYDQTLLQPLEEQLPAKAKYVVERLVFAGHFQSVAAATEYLMLKNPKDLTDVTEVSSQKPDFNPKSDYTDDRSQLPYPCMKRTLDAADAPEASS